MPTEHHEDNSTPASGLSTRDRTREEIATWMETLRNPETATGPSHPSLLFLRHHGQEFALPATSIIAVEPVGPTHRIPHRSNEIMRGIASTRGELVPLGDLAAVLNLSRRETDPDSVPRLVSIGPPDNSWTFIADIIHGIEVSDPEEWVTLEQDDPTMIAKARLETSHGQVLLLDAERLLNGFGASLT